MPGYSGAGAGFKKPFTVDQIPGLKQASEFTKGRAYPEYVAPDWDIYGESGIRTPTGKYYIQYVDPRTVDFMGEGGTVVRSYINPKDLVFKEEPYYDPDHGVGGTQTVAYSTGQSLIDQALEDPNKWVASNIDWGGLGHYGNFSALDEQMKFLKDNKYDLSTLPNQGGLNQYNLTKQILDQGTTGKWSGAGYGSPVENAKVMAGMLANTGIKDIKDFGKFNGVVSRFDQYVRPKDPADLSKGYVYDEIVGDEFTGKTLDLPKDIPIRQQSIWDNDAGSFTNAIASMPVYGETFGNKVTKQSFVDTQNYNRAHGDIFSGTYIGHGHTGYGVQFAADGTPYFYTRFGGDTSSMADIAPVLSFLAVIPTPLQPFAAAANALISLDNGNTLGALASLAGIPGVSEAAGAAGLASVASAVKTANQVVNLVNAIETGNVMALATSAAGMLGANTGSIQIGDTGLTVSDAMKAVNLVKAFESGNPLGMFNAAVSFGTAPNIQKALNSPTTTLDADGQRVADFVGPTFVADLVDPNSENFLGGAEESLGTVLAEAPDNIGSFDSVFGGLKDFGSKYFSGPSQDFFTSQAPAGDGDLVGPTYTPESIGSVGNLMSGPSTDVAGGSNLVDLAAIERERGQVTLGDIQGKQIDLTNVAPGSTLPEVVVGGPSKEDVANLLKAEDEEVQADLEKAITDAENEVDPAEVERQEAARFEAARVEAERIEAERLEAERAAAEVLRQEEIQRQAEVAEIEARKEAERQLEIAEAARLAKVAEDQAEAERAAKEAKDEADRQAVIAAEAKAEADRVRQEAEAEKLRQEEAERVRQQEAEAERLRQEEVDRLKQEEADRQAELAREAAAKAEADRVETQRIEAERLEAARVEAERIEAERVEAERVEAERLEAERVEAERVRQEEAEAEILRQEEIRRQAEEARLEAQREAARQLEIAEAARLAREAEDQAEAERLAQEAEDEAARQAAIVAEAQTEAERLRLEAAEAARIESERLEAQRLEAERLAAEKEAQDVEDARLEAERLRQETVGDQVDDGVSTDTSGADGLAGAADENTLIGGDGAANNGVTSEDDWLGGTGNDSLDGGVSTDTSGSNDGLLDLSSEEVGQGEVDAINDDALLDLSSAEVGQDEQDAINNDALLGLSSAEVGEEEQKAIDEAEGTDDDGNCKPGFHRDPTGLCVSDEDEPEPQECQIGEVRDLATGLCVPAPSTGGGGGGGSGGGNTPVRRVVTTGALPGIFSTSERPIVTAPSINDDPVMRGALPDMPQETKFQGPLDQFLKLAMESPTPKPQQPQQQQAGNMNDRLTYPQGNTDYFTYGQQSDIDNNLYSQFGQAPTDQPMDGALQFAQGGLAVPLMAAGGTRYGQYAGGGLNVVEHSGKHRVDFRKGDAVTGPGDGQSDDIPAMLADGEFVFPADVVAALGNGSTKAGSDKLYDMMHSIRAYHRSAKPKDLPPPAKKSPLDYLKGKKSTKARS